MTLSPPTTQASTVIVGGHKYRVNSSASPDQLARFAALVDERLLALPLSQRGDPKSLVLVALGLAHDLEEERQLRATNRSEMEIRVRTLIAQVDDALGHVDLNGDFLPTLVAEPAAAPAGSERTLPTASPERTMVRTGLTTRNKAATSGSSDTTKP